VGLGGPTTLTFAGDFRSTQTYSLGFDSMKTGGVGWGGGGGGFLQNRGQPNPTGIQARKLKRLNISGSHTHTHTHTPSTYCIFSVFLAGSNSVFKTQLAQIIKINTLDAGIRNERKFHISKESY